MTKEQLRMQMLAGVITESEYTAVINKEIEEADKASLNESMIGGIVGIGAINQIPATPKTDYEMAFEHFLGERYEVKPNRERDDITDIKEDETSEMEDEVEDEISMNEEELDESVLAVAGGIVLGILGLKTLARIMKGIFGAVSLIRMTDPKKLKEAVAEIGREAIMKRGKNPLQVALWMTTVNSMIDSGEVKNGVDLGKTWGNIDKIDLERVFSSSESGEVEEGKEVEEPSLYEGDLNESNIDQMTAGIKDAFDAVRSLPLPDNAKLGIAKTGIGIATLNAIEQKISAGQNISPEGQARLQKAIATIKQATSIEEIEQALLDAVINYSSTNK
jgi:hypothetical protein